MILLSIIGFAAVLGLFSAVNLEERILLSFHHNIEQHPTDVDYEPVTTAK